MRKTLVKMYYLNVSSVIKSLKNYNMLEFKSCAT